MPGCGAATLQSPITRSVSRVGRGHERTLQRYGVRVMGNARGDSRGRAQLKVLRAVRQRSTRCRRWWSRRAVGEEALRPRAQQDVLLRCTVHCAEQGLQADGSRPSQSFKHHAPLCLCFEILFVLATHPGCSSTRRFRSTAVASGTYRLSPPTSSLQNGPDAELQTCSEDDRDPCSCFAPRRWRPPLPLLTGALGSQEPRRYCFVTTGMKGVDPANVPPSYESTV